MISVITVIVYFIVTFFYYLSLTLVRDILDECFDYKRSIIRYFVDHFTSEFPTVGFSSEQEIQRPSVEHNRVVQIGSVNGDKLQKSLTTKCYYTDVLADSRSSYE